MELEQEHEVYGGEIADEGDMDADIDMSRVDDEDESASKVCFLSISLHFVSVYVY